MKYNLVSYDDVSNLTVVTDDGDMYVADNNHPNWDSILGGVLADDEDVIALFNPAEAVREQFEVLTNRVTVRGGKLVVDQTVVEDVFADLAVRLLGEGGNFWPLVKFHEKLAGNTDASVRSQLARWMQAEDMTLSEEGDIIGYRAVRNDFKSKNAGPGIVNGEYFAHAHLDNSPGNIVEIPVENVTVDPNIGCASGLHVGAWSYLPSFKGMDDVVVRVVVDPRHVRSVPYECDSQKMRVSRFRVLGVADEKYQSVAEYLDEDDDYGY